MKKIKFPNINISLKSPLETIIGIFVFIVAIYFSSLIFLAKDQSSLSNYKIFAEFSDIGGLKKGTDVRISGMSVGKVASIFMDKNTHRVKLKMIVRDDINIPSDSSVKIRNSGLVGDRYIGIIPGVTNDSIKDGDELYFTQDAVDFEDIIGKFLIKN
jgi:phospholipid/cholesterol/gamma-HCH transport system substrate-binding protein